MRDAIMASLFQLARENPDVMLLTADLGFGVFERFSEEFPGQYLNVGVAEQNMMGVASGLALEGKIIFTYSIGNFPTLRCLEQIRNDACYHDLNINIIASGGGFSYGGLGMSHHATEDLSIMRALPGVTVLAPTTPWEAGQSIYSLANTTGVGYLRIDKSAAQDPMLDTSFEIGVARTLRAGDMVTIFAAGGIAAEAIKAAEEVSADGVECRVLSMHSLKPIDTEAIKKSINETDVIITVEENNVVGGLGSAISEAILDMSLNVKRMGKIGMRDEYSAVVGGQDFLRKYYKMNSESITKLVKELYR